MKAVRAVALVLLAMLASGACGSGEDVGSEDMLDFEEQKADQLGAATPTPKPTAAGAKAPAASTPQPAAAAAKTAAPAQTSYFDVQLVGGSPYYAPGDRLRMPAGTTLRVTNKDTTPERAKGRSFSAENDAFDSGLLKPNGVWTMKLSTKGTFTIVDKGLTFARAQLEVY